MLFYRKTRVVAVTCILLLLACSFLWPRSQSVPTVYLPDGSTASLVEGQITDIHWRRFERSAPAPSSISLPRRIVARAAYRLMELQGKLSIPIPNPPRRIDLLGNVSVFPDRTQKTYLIAEELLSASGSNWINFRFGGPRNARSRSEWVQANLDCIRTNGVVVGNSTTLCAVVVDRDTVSILPAYHFGFGHQSIPLK